MSSSPMRAVLARAKAEGWTIVIPIKDEDYGGRGFSCLDPEGRLWNVGTYDPGRGRSRPRNRLFGALEVALEHADVHDAASAEPGQRSAALKRTS